MASPGCKHGKDGVQPLLPQEKRYWLPSEHQPSPGQGANAAVGLKRKEELPPCNCPALLQPHQPRRVGVPEERSVPQRSQSEQDGSRRSGRLGLGMLTMRRRALPAAPPASPRLAPGLLPGARGEGGAPCPARPGMESAGGCPEKAGCGGRRPPPAAGGGIRMRTACIAI